jgi:hypothetical protein
MPHPAPSVHVLHPFLTRVPSSYLVMVCTTTKFLGHFDGDVGKPRALQGHFDGDVGKPNPEDTSTSMFFTNCWDKAFEKVRPTCKHSKQGTSTRPSETLLTSVKCTLTRKQCKQGASTRPSETLLISVKCILTHNQCKQGASTRPSETLTGHEGPEEQGDRDAKLG